MLEFWLEEAVCVCVFLSPWHSQLSFTEILIWFPLQVAFPFRQSMFQKRFSDRRFGEVTSCLCIVLITIAGVTSVSPASEQVKLAGWEVSDGYSVAVRGQGVKRAVSFRGICNPWRADSSSEFQRQMRGQFWNRSNWTERMNSLGKMGE